MSLRDYTSRLLNLSTTSSQKVVERCLQSVSEEFNISKFQITELLSGLQIPGEVYIPEIGYVPEKFPDAEEINMEPDGYIIANFSSLPDLERAVKIAAWLYFNSDGGGLDDNSYDALEYYLKKRKKLRGRAYEKIGAPPVEKIRTKLPYQMPSLPKVKPNEVDLTNFLFISSEVVCMDKLDGVSGMIVYDSEGNLSGIYTRGDGEHGGDVTYLKEHIQHIPLKYKPNYAVRGEFVMSRKVFDKNYSSDYSNARSIVSAKINSGFISEALKDMEFVAYSIIDAPTRKDIPTELENLSDSFKVVYHTFFGDLTVYSLIEYYKSRRADSEYLIDGIVLSHTPPGSKRLAFKMRLESQIRDTQAIGVEWNPSRYGKIIPVVLYKSVYVDGVRMHRASGHNAKHIRDWNMGRGTNIRVVRSGDVIPQIVSVDVDESVDIIYPDEDLVGGEWKWQGPHILLQDIETNRYVCIKRLYHFFSTLGIKGFGEKTAEALYNVGFRYPLEVATASPKMLTKAKGIGAKRAQSFHDSIQQTLRMSPPDRLMVASTTLNAGIGRKLLKELLFTFPEVLEIDDISEALKKKKIKGFGPKRIATISKGIPKFKRYLQQFGDDVYDSVVGNYISKISRIKAGDYNRKIAGKSFVLSGFMGKTDYDLEDSIYDNLGTISSSVTPTTAAVISANLLIPSEKYRKAQSLGVPVLSIPEFKKRFS